MTRPAGFTPSRLTIGRAGYSRHHQPGYHDETASYGGAAALGGEVVTLTDEGTIIGTGTNATTKKRQQRKSITMLSAASRGPKC